MSFKDELQKINPVKSIKISKVKKILKDSAKAGEKSVTLGKSYYDDQVIEFLKSEGFDYKLYDDFRDGDYIVVKW